MELIRCPAPLPEDSATPVLTRMLASTPYQARAGDGEKTQDDLGSGGKSDTGSEKSTFPRPKTEAEKDPVSLLQAGGKGPPPKIGRKRLLSEARCLHQAAQARRASTRSLMMRTSLRPNRK